jgi:hypothetical protein
MIEFYINTSLSGLIYYLNIYFFNLPNSYGAPRNEAVKF